jgi:hypothetical protein
MKKIIAIIICIFIKNIVTTYAQTKIDSVTKADEIVRQFRTDPIEFTKQMANYIDKIDNVELNELILKLYSGYSAVPENSDAAMGTMGFLNKYFNKKHNKVFKKNIIKKNATRNGKYLILIEGDSWFNFPLPLKSDLTKIIRRKKNMLVYTSAFGGDWLSKMIKDQSYFTELKRLRPDFFIISGGGNDIVGETISKIVDLPEKNTYVFKTGMKKEDKSKLKIDKNNWKNNFNNSLETYFLNDNTFDDEILEGTKYLNRDFFITLAAQEIQYRIILKQIKNDSALEETKVITQGYDYPIPSNKKKCILINFWQGVVNRFIGTGKWLYFPLKIKGIDEAVTQRKVMKAMMYYYNATFIKLANEKDTKGDYVFKKLTHIDNRNVIKKLNKGDATSRRYWFDELHPKRKPYDKIAEVYEKIITGIIKECRVYKTIDNFDVK